MDIVTAIRSRKSIRGFKPDPVPREILEQILDLARRAPSTMNTQPWEFVVLTGEVLQKITQENVRKLRGGVMIHPEHVITGWPSNSVFRARQVEVARRIFDLMGIPREDKEKRAAWMERGFCYFDAPVAVIILTDRALTEAGPLMDIGAVMQTICLAALEHGLGTCIEDQGVMYPENIRQAVNIPESKRVVISIAIGYPDKEFPANRLESPREPLDKIVSWYGFE
ncbi:MAG: nitroreductase [Syntrophaceae bacterium]|nr:nitroreductase [Deltaproteobacteria bacterium]